MSDIANARAVRPVFVLGAPRSGTTMVGNFIGSSSQVCNLVEYSGFYFLDTIARREYSTVPFPAKDLFFQELFELAKSFAERYAASEGKSYYVDSTPWNLLVANTISQNIPNAAFVMCIRRHEGVVQSLTRSFDCGFSWAGSTLAHRLKLWLFMNSLLLKISHKVIHYFHYDRMCTSPETEIGKLEQFLTQLGLEDCNREIFAQGHAAAGRPTVAVKLGKAVAWEPIASFDKESWDSQLETSLQNVTSLTLRAAQLQQQLDLLGTE